jgi:hypothetical protein
MKQDAKRQIWDAKRRTDYFIGLYFEGNNE